MKRKFNIDSDISKAETLPSSFYKDLKIFEELKTKIFLKSWQWVGDSDLVKDKNSVYPQLLLEDYLTEPIVLTRDESDTIHCLTNVCTHRGNILVFEPGKSKKLVCMYHGRRFNNKGDFEFMPEFDKTKDFPRPCDNLHKFPLIKWGKLLFAGLNPSFDFQTVIDKMSERIGFLPINEFKPDSTLSKDFTVNAHWALYCDNYLEGFHIPFVHKDLNKELEYEDYFTQGIDNTVLQIGIGKDNENTFDLPKKHRDYGKNVSAYYFFLFPNMMFNFYPWGLSINVVKPKSPEYTEIEYFTYVWKEELMEKGAGADLDKVELEDEEIVESVQKGVKSNSYDRGRYSPKREIGVHHFHLLLQKYY